MFLICRARDHRIFIVLHLGEEFQSRTFAIYKSQMHDLRAICKSKMCDSCYWVASMATPVGKWVDLVVVFSASGKIFPIPPLLSNVFVRRVFSAYVWSVSGGSRNAWILSDGHSRIFN